MSRASLGGYAATGQGHFLVVAVKLGLDERNWRQNLPGLKVPKNFPLVTNTGLVTDSIHDVDKSHHPPRLHSVSSRSVEMGLVVPQFLSGSKDTMIL